MLDDSSRPGDITIDRSWPLRPGKSKIAFDVTVTSPLRRDVWANSLQSATYALEKAREAKFRKYDGKLPNHVGLVPLAVSTFGAWEFNAGANLREIVRQQAANMRMEVGKIRRHFFQRLSVTLQRENGAMLLERSPLLNFSGHVDGSL